MNAVAGGSDWELCKENVLPLRQGRRVSVLNSSLQATVIAAHHDDTVARKLAHQRRLFELEIRTYVGSDPLDPWHRYILWAEQHYPRGGHEGHLDKLLDNCIKLFKDCPDYQQDARYIRLWLLMARRSHVPLEVLQFMFRHEVGTQLAVLYTTWSCYYELAGNMARADRVLAEGARRAAEPLETLTEARRKLQQRVAAGVKTGKLGACGDAGQPSVTEDVRRAFGVLKTEPGAAAPRVRVGPALSSKIPAPLLSSTDVSSTSSTNARKQSNRTVLVYRDQDGGDGETSLSTQPSTISTPLPTSSLKEKENVQRPGPWTRPMEKIPVSGMRQHSRGRVQLAQCSGVSLSARAGTPSFCVFEDDSSAAEAHKQSGSLESAGGPRSKSSATAVSKTVLSERTSASTAGSVSCASSTGESWNLPVAEVDHTEPGVRPMYCKSLIYAGVDEVSFEELRAVDWLRRYQNHATPVAVVCGERNDQHVDIDTSVDYSGEKHCPVRKVNHSVENRVLQCVSINSLGSREDRAVLGDRVNSPHNLRCSQPAANIDEVGASVAFSVLEDNLSEPEDKDIDSDKENQPPSSYTQPQTSTHFRRPSGLVLTDITPAVAASSSSSSPSSDASTSSPDASQSPSASYGVDAPPRLSSQRRLVLDDVDSSGVRAFGDVSSGLTGVRTSTAHATNMVSGAHSGDDDCQLASLRKDTAKPAAVNLLPGFSRLTVGDV